MDDYAFPDEVLKRSFGIWIEKVPYWTFGVLVCWYLDFKVL